MIAIAKEKRWKQDGRLFFKETCALVFRGAAGKSNKMKRAMQVNNRQMAQALATQLAVEKTFRQVAQEMDIPAASLAGLWYQERRFDPNFVGTTLNMARNDRRDVGTTQAPKRDDAGDTWRDALIDVRFFHPPVFSAGSIQIRPLGRTLAALKYRRSARRR